MRTLEAGWRKGTFYGNVLAHGEDFPLGLGLCAGLPQSGVRQLVKYMFRKFMVDLTGVTPNTRIPSACTCNMAWEGFPWR